MPDLGGAHTVPLYPPGGTIMRSRNALARASASGSISRAGCTGYPGFLAVRRPIRWRYQARGDPICVLAIRISEIR